MRASNLSSDDGDRMDARKSDGEAAKDKPSGCCASTKSCMKNQFKSLTRSTKKAIKSPSILLPTLLSFSILTAAGLFAVIHSSHQYHSTQSWALLEQSRELAHNLDDLLCKALLPLFTLKEMAGQFDEFRELHSQILEHESYINEEGRSFRNVTEMCTDDQVWELYSRAATSIEEGSKMGSVLFNVQLQPAGTVCLNHPRNTTYADGMEMDHTKAIGLDRIHDLYQSTSARNSILKKEIGSTGPIVLVQDTEFHEGKHEPHETLIFWTPIYYEGYDLETQDGVMYEDFWGFAGVLLDWDEIVRQIGLYEFYADRGMRFALLEVGEDEVVASSDEPALTREEAEQVLQLQCREGWELLVQTPPAKAGDPSWVVWGSILVVLASFVVSLMFMLVLVRKKDHDELLCRIIPHHIVRRLHAGETVIEKYDVATICFIDIVSFTTMSGRMKAHEVMEMLQILFREFDR
jgi:sensor domain CHASE-containing protein